jgi:hypothetical protein
LHIVVDHWPIDLARFVAGSGGLRMSPGKRAPGKHDESGTDQNKLDHDTHSSSPHSRTQWPALMRLHVASRPQDWRGTPAPKATCLLSSVQSTRTPQNVRCGAQTLFSALTAAEAGD